MATLLQYSCLGNPMDREASQATVHGSQTDGKQWKQLEILFFGSKINADGDYSHEIKRRLLLSNHGYQKLGEGFPSGPVVKNPPCNAGDTGLISGPRRSHMPQGN